MIYALVSGALFGALFGLSAQSVSPTGTTVGLASAVLMFASIYGPRFLFRYSSQQDAPTVLSQLIARATVGGGLVLASGALALLISGGWNDARTLGEMYAFTLIGLLLFQGVGEVVTQHVLYLQRTNQYNSNQLFAMLVGMAVILFVLILYFLAFDLAQPPDMHRYGRDLLATTFVLLGYGRAVFLMAHH